ncbi:MAG: tripartite tricarboxylate transporter substrate binding protein [Hyphomicrobiales bacterium]|nr:tripartite tricarboxylate transporter substrate binding protein [Hyphomicrobiales bacterium]
MSAPSTLTRPLVRLLAAAAALALAATTAAAQSYPAKPIRFLVPFAAGGPADTMARLTAQVLQQELGQTIVIDNRPGAGGIIGARVAAAAEPDGYTLMYGNTASLAVGPAVYANPGYDPLKAFAPIALVAVSFNVLALNPAFPANTVKELIAHAKKNPGKVNFASPGHGTPPHMVGEMFKQRAAIDIVHIPYKGTAAALTDIIGGQVELAFENPAVIVPLVQAGKLKALGVTGETRNPALPDVPTMIEAGLPDFVSMSFTGLVAPAGTPAAIIKQVSDILQPGLATPEMRAMMDKLGVIPRPGTPADFGVFLARESAKWQTVAKAAGIRIKN